MSRFDDMILQRYEEKGAPEPMPNCWYCSDCGEMFDRPVMSGCPNCRSLYIERSYSESLAELLKGRVNMYAL